MRRYVDVALAVIALVGVPLTVGLIAHSGAPSRSSGPTRSALAVAGPILRLIPQVAGHCYWGDHRTAIHCSLKRGGTCDIQLSGRGRIRTPTTATCQASGKNGSESFLILQSAAPAP